MQHKTWRTLSLIVLGVVLALSHVSAFAQSSFGQIAGTVTDPTGAAVPDAQITVTSVNTQAKRVIVSDGDGNYLVTNLPIGEYSLAITKTGFRTSQQAGVYISADAKVTSNITLQLGQATEVVEVQAGVIESLNTTSGELARVLNDLSQLGRHVPCEEGGDDDGGQEGDNYRSQQLLPDSIHLPIDVMERNREPESALLKRHCHVEHPHAERETGSNVGARLAGQSSLHLRAAGMILHMGAVGVGFRQHVAGVVDHSDSSSGRVSDALDGGLRQ